MVCLFVLHRLAGICTNIYNACRTIVRLIKPFGLRRFRCRCGLCKIFAVVGPVPERRNNSIQGCTYAKQTSTPRGHYFYKKLLHEFSCSSIYRHISRKVLKCFFYRMRVILAWDVQLAVIAAKRTSQRWVENWEFALTPEKRTISWGIPTFLKIFSWKVPYHLSPFRKFWNFW